MNPPYLRHLCLLQDTACCLLNPLRQNDLPCSMHVPFNSFSSLELLTCRVSSLRQLRR